MIAPNIPPQNVPLSDGAGASFGKTWWLFFGELTTGLGLALKLSTSGTHAQRLLADPAKYQQGSLYAETDRGVVYQNRLVNAVGTTKMAPTWVYLYGEMDAPLASIPVDLALYDAGFLFGVTDFGHRLQWNGTGWSWAIGEEGSGETKLFEIDPTSAGWHLYDGTAGVLYLKSDATTGTVTLPDLVSTTAKAAYLKAGSPDGGPNAAIAPTLTGSGDTDPALTGITNPPDTGSTSPGNTGAPSATQLVASGSATAVASSTHTHVEAAHVHTIGAPTDPTHFHTLTGVTVSNTGEPRNLVRRPWFRQ